MDARSLRSGGFTLIEVLLVLVIMALVMAATLPPLMGSGGAAEMRAASLEIAAALRQARSLAITRARPQVFTIDTASGAYLAGGARMTGRLPGDVHAVLITTTDERDNGTTGNIRFFPDGSATGGGIRLIQGNRRTDVMVDWLTGRVSIDGDTATH
ncbi:MAG TPA: GspH/FimT family pseudopilin [Stellaceae bacterium]|nr:GspH/FimT family pseudopilin [Stellaceae bacterium]